jgi:type VI secretion system secreted protein VgrG
MPDALMELAVAGEPGLSLHTMKGSEELGRLFEYDVHALAEPPDIKPTDLLGKRACVSVQQADNSERYFHGVICAMGYAGPRGQQHRYRLVLRPWLWMLTRRKDTRIFQNKTLRDILQAVFKPFGADYEFELQGNYPTYVYCVQYRESDFDFVSRLMEQEGIYYYFRHEKSKHTLVMVDAPQAHQPCASHATFTYRHSADPMLELDAITEWNLSHEIQSGRAVLQDYDFEKPKTSLEGDARASRQGASGTLEVYDYPGAYATKAEGDRYAGLRLEELQARTTSVTGFGSLRSMATGYTFTLAEHFREDQNARHLVVATHVDLAYSGYESGDDRTHYVCHFTAMDMTERFRPQRRTRKPTVPGPHTAVVVGPPGEELHVDAHGRVKVQFHWDRIGQHDAESSCWVRVAHPWAGKGYGMQALPRIGQEVVVEFLEGDPDRPLITGRVHNADQTPPFKLPDHATVSTIRSRSSKGGGDADFNELRFEDDKGKEHVWFQAQRDYYQYVKNDAWTVIDRDSFRIIKRDRQEEVQRDLTQSVGRDVKQQVKGKANLTIDGDQRIKVGGKQGTKVQQDVLLQAGMDGQFKFGANLAVDAGANVHIKGGANLVIEAGAMITLKAGASSIVIGPTLSITGPMVNINSGGAPGAGSGVTKSPDAPEVPKELQPPKDPLEG